MLMCINLLLKTVSNMFLFKFGYVCFLLWKLLSLLKKWNFVWFRLTSTLMLLVFLIEFGGNKNNMEFKWSWFQIGCANSTSQLSKHSSSMSWAAQEQICVLSSWAEHEGRACRPAAPQNLTWTHICALQSSDHGTHRILSEMVFRLSD